MGKVKEAIECFKSTLKIDAHNKIALQTLKKLKEDYKNGNIKF
jgi:hypothetical protein